MLEMRLLLRVMLNNNTGTFLKMHMYQFILPLGWSCEAGAIVLPSSPSSFLWSHKASKLLKQRLAKLHEQLSDHSVPLSHSTCPGHVLKKILMIFFSKFKIF